MPKESTSARPQRKDSDTTPYRKYMIRADLEKLGLNKLVLYAKALKVDFPKKKEEEGVQEEEENDEVTKQWLLDEIFSKTDKVYPLKRSRSYRTSAVERDILTSRHLADKRATMVEQKAGNKNFNPHKHLIKSVGRAYDHLSGDTDGQEKFLTAVQSIAAVKLSASPRQGAGPDPSKTVSPELMRAYKQSLRARNSPIQSTAGPSTTNKSGPRVLARQRTLPANDPQFLAPRNGNNVPQHVNGNQPQPVGRTLSREPTMTILPLASAGAQSSPSPHARRALTRQPTEPLNEDTPTNVEPLEVEANPQVPAPDRVLCRKRTIREVDEQVEAAQTHEEQGDSGLASEGSADEQSAKRLRVERRAEDSRANFDDFFPTRRIPLDPLSAGYRPTMVYTIPPEPPLNPEDPEWLQEMFAGLQQERQTLLDMLDYMKRHSAEALVEAELTAYDVAQEMTLIQGLLRRIGVAAGQHVVDHLEGLVSQGEGDSSDESEVEPEVEIHTDEVNSEEPLFGPAELAYDPEQMAELMADAIPTEPHVVPRAEGPVVDSALSSPEAQTTPPAGGSRNKRTRGDEQPAGDCDADDERSPKRPRWREPAREGTDSSSSSRSNRTPDSPGSPVGVMGIETATGSPFARLAANGSQQRFPRTPGRPSTSTLARSSGATPAMRAFRGFDTQAVFDPNDPAGRMPSALNPTYRENGDMFTPLYLERVGTFNFGGAPAEQAQPATAARRMNGRSAIAYPTMGHRTRDARGPALREVTGGRRVVPASRTLARTATEPTLVPAQQAGGSNPNASRAGPSTERVSRGDISFGQAQAPQYEDEQLYISHARS